MHLALISVPHTGTRWSCKLFESQRPRWRTVGLNTPPHKTPHLFHGHCTKGTQTGFAVEWAKKGVPLIMPMRHPYRVEESWRRRDERDMSGLFPAYENMLDVLLPHVSAWLPVDGSPLVRAIAEQKLNEIVGRTLVYNWQKPVNVVGKTNELTLADTEPSDRMRELRRHPLFTQFYGNADDEDHEIRQS